MSIRKILAPLYITAFALCLGLFATPAQAQNNWDLYGDGNASVLWFNPTLGDVLAWDVNDTNIINQSYLAQSVPTGWQVVGTDYFDAAGDLGILWYNAQLGDVLLWDVGTTQGTTGITIVNQGYVVQGLPTSWQIVGTGDFYGDGSADILWYNSQLGDVVVWEMNDTNIGQTDYIAQGVPAGWQIVGTGYFDAAGDLGILWYNAQLGDVLLWDIGTTQGTTGITIVNSGLIAQSLPAVWQIAGIGYFDDAGDAGILWYNTQTGDVALWDMSDATIINQGYIAMDTPQGWQIAGIRNDQNNPYAQILWYDSLNGDVLVWDMNDMTIVNQGYPAMDTPQGWQIVNPQ